MYPTRVRSTWADTFGRLRALALVEYAVFAQLLEPIEGLVHRGSGAARDRGSRRRLVAPVKHSRIRLRRASVRLRAF